MQYNISGTIGFEFARVIFLHYLKRFFMKLHTFVLSWLTFTFFVSNLCSNEIAEGSNRINIRIRKSYKNVYERTIELNRYRLDPNSSKLYFSLDEIKEAAEEPLNNLVVTLGNYNVIDETDRNGKYTYFFENKCYIPTKAIITRAYLWVHLKNWKDATDF